MVKDIFRDRITIISHCLVVTLAEIEKGISWKSLFKAQNRITIYEYIQICLDAHSSVVKNTLKPDEM